ECDAVAHVEICGASAHDRQERSTSANQLLGVSVVIRLGDNLKVLIVVNRDASVDGPKACRVRSALDHGVPVCLGLAPHMDGVGNVLSTNTDKDLVLVNVANVHEDGV